MDYEHQPANHLAFRLAQRILLPEAVPERDRRRQGAAPPQGDPLSRASRRRSTSPTSSPIPSILARLGVDAPAGDGARRRPLGARRRRLPPRREPDLRATACADLDASRRRRHRRPRPPRQSSATRCAALGLERLVVPAGAVDARSLLCAADAFVGAGGTMTREAALLGLPTFSVFAGAPPGRRRRARAPRAGCTALSSPAQLAAIRPRDERRRGPRPARALERRSEIRERVRRRDRTPRPRTRTPSMQRAGGNPMSRRPQVPFVDLDRRARRLRRGDRRRDRRRRRPRRLHPRRRGRALRGGLRRATSASSTRSASPPGPPPCRSPPRPPGIERGDEVIVPAHTYIASALGGDPRRGGAGLLRRRRRDRPDRSRLGRGGGRSPIAPPRSSPSTSTARSCDRRAARDAVPTATRPDADRGRGAGPRRLLRRSPRRARSATPPRSASTRRKNLGAFGDAGMV